jgi:hypothetical protein
MSEVSLDSYKAEERRMALAEAHRGLRIHLAVTILVCIGLAMVNVFVASEFPWAVFPALGMSLGVWFHWNFGVRHGEQFVQRHQDDVEREVARHQNAA